MHRSLNILLTLVFVGLFWSAVAGQSRPPGVICPGSDVVVSAESVTDGDKVIFRSDLRGGNIDRNVLVYYWQIDRGKIIAGQGSPVIAVDTTGTGPAGSITAIVNISPFEFCCWAASETVLVRRAGPPTKADVFWEWFRLNSAAIGLDDPATPSAFADQLSVDLSKVDSNLAIEIGPRRPNDHRREVIVTIAGRPPDQKLLDAFVERSPIFFNFAVLASKPRP